MIGPFMCSRAAVGWRPVCSEEHDKFMKEHAGHESMHAEMMLVLLVTLVCSQVTPCCVPSNPARVLSHPRRLPFLPWQLVLVLWHTHHPSSYKKVTLLGMWLFPLYFSITLAVRSRASLLPPAAAPLRSPGRPWRQFVRMLATWLLFTVCTAVVVYLATRHPIPRATPRRVYYYFFGIYKAAYIAACLGYFLAVLAFMGLWRALGDLVALRWDEHEYVAGGRSPLF